MHPEVVVALLGDFAVGKTSILRYYAYDETANQKEPGTIGTQRTSVNPRPDQPAILTIIDTAGDEKYRAVIPSSIRNACAFLLVFDLSRRDSLANILNWTKFIVDSLGEPFTAYLIGAKSDLEHSLTPEEIADFQRRHGLAKYYMTSAMTGEGIPEMFKAVVSDCLPRAAPPQTDQLQAQDSSECC
jgi:small GTP-binding protein